MKRFAAVSAVALIALSVTACGETRGERALTGGAIGAGAGALGGAALGFDPLTGAVIGGAAGAVAGAASGDRDRDRRAYRDSDGDGIPNYDDRYPRNPYRD
ncbi:MAG: YMGG-like glycine zipper-containing protein [Rhodospirillaceae bacterium]